MCCIEEHVQQALSSSGRIVAPYDIVKNLSHICQDFQLGNQEDAHECMRLFLDALQKCCLPDNSDKNISDPNLSIFQKIFGGCLKSQVKCTDCSHSFDTFDPFLDLSLDIVHAGSLARALACFTAVDIMDGDDKYHCGKCQRRVRALKRFTIHKAPVILTIQLKRFNSDAGLGRKLDKRINFGQTLDLKPFTSNGQEAIRYRLYAVLVHSGSSVDGGHYFCYVQTSAETWHLLDDSLVQQVDEKTVLEQEAYMLFYCRELIVENASHSEAKKMQLSQQIKPSQRSPTQYQNAYLKSTVEQEERRHPLVSSKLGSSMQMSPTAACLDNHGVMNNCRLSKIFQLGDEELPSTVAQSFDTMSRKEGFHNDTLDLKENEGVNAKKSTQQVRAGNTQASIPNFTYESKLKCLKLLQGMPQSRRSMLADFLPNFEGETIDISTNSTQQENKLRDSKKRKLAEAAGQVGNAEKDDGGNCSLGHSKHQFGDIMLSKCTQKGYDCIENDEQQLTAEQIHPKDLQSCENEIDTSKLCGFSKSDIYFAGSSSSADEKLNHSQKSMPWSSSNSFTSALTHDELQSGEARHDYTDVGEASWKDIDTWIQDFDKGKVEKVRKGTQGARLIACKTNGVDDSNNNELKNSLVNIRKSDLATTFKHSS